MTNDERARLDVIEAKVDTIIVKLQYIEKQTGDHDDRLRGVEKWKYALPATLVLAASAVLGEVIGRL